MEDPFAPLTEMPKTARDIPKHRRYGSTPNTVSLDRIGGVETRLKYTHIGPSPEVAPAADMEGSTGQQRALNTDHRKIKKIACLGSGFVGGTICSIAPSTLDTYASSRSYLCRYCLQNRHTSDCRRPQCCTHSRLEFWSFADI